MGHFSDDLAVTTCRVSGQADCPKGVADQGQMADLWIHQSPRGVDAPTSLNESMPYSHCSRPSIAGRAEEQSTEQRPKVRDLRWSVIPEDRTQGRRFSAKGRLSCLVGLTRRRRCMASIATRRPCSRWRMGDVADWSSIGPAVSQPRGGTNAGRFALRPDGSRAFSSRSGVRPQSVLM
jgi:hypothetical protein